MESPGASGIPRKTRRNTHQPLDASYWQATGRYEEPQAGTWGYWSFDRSAKLGQKAPNRTSRSRSTIGSGRLKILGPETGVRVRSPPSAPNFTTRSDAAEFLKTRIGEALAGKIVLSKNVTYDHLRDLIITDYTNNERKSLGDLKTTRLPRLDSVFGGTKAIDITTTSVERYKTLR